jgi:hypothetical protein
LLYICKRPHCSLHLLCSRSLISTQGLQGCPQPPLLLPPGLALCIQQPLAAVQLPLGALHCRLLGQLPRSSTHCCMVALQHCYTRLLLLLG